MLHVSSCTFVLLLRKCGRCRSSFYSATEKIVVWEESLRHESAENADKSENAESYQEWEPVDHLQGSLGPGGPKKSQKSLPGPLARGPPRVWKKSRKGLESLEKVPKRLFRDLFQTLGGARGSYQEWPRETKPKKGQFMNSSQGHSGTKVQCESRLFS